MFSEELPLRTEPFDKAQKRNREPPLQIHHQKDNPDNCLAAFGQSCHHSIETVTAFCHAKLPFNCVADFLVFLLLFASSTVLLGLFRGTSQWYATQPDTSIFAPLPILPGSITLVGVHRFRRDAVSVLIALDITHQITAFVVVRAH